MPNKGWSRPRIRPPLIESLSLPQLRAAAHPDVRRLSQTTMKRLANLTIIYILLCSIRGLGQERVPKFSDYPARVIHTRRSVNVRIHSTPYTACFLTANLKR